MQSDGESSRESAQRSVMEHASQFEMPTGTVVSVLDREGVWAQVRSLTVVPAM